MSYRSQPTVLSFGPSLTPAVKWLIIANAAVFLLQIYVGVRFPGFPFDRWFGLVPFAVTHLKLLWQPFTYLFLHNGFGHILVNMFTLWMFGCDLERSWGRRRFLFYYFLTGVGAALLNIFVKTLFYPPGHVALGTPTVGASGAIYGVLLAFGLLFPERIILLWFIIPIPARIFVLIMGILTFLASLGASGDNVSHISHLGGMLFGLIYLRGRRWLDFPLLRYNLRMAYWNWKRRRLQKKFEIYMRDQDRDEHRHDRWIH